jgi:transglutaminase-like putative cysteine protease
VNADARSQVAATLVFTGATLIIITQAPLWTTAIALACAGWRWLLATGRVPAPRPRKGMRFLFGAITAVMVGAVLMSFRTLNGLAAGTALLVLMGALKLLESRTRRDDGIVIGVSLFLLLAAALGDQSLARVPLYLVLVWGACAALMLVAHPGSSLPVRAALRLSARALAMAIPLAAALFLFFPRLGGHFWALPGQGEATTGLSDSMSPTAIDELVSNYDPAFRVSFEGALPPPEARYWRGPVFSSFDGFTWRGGRRYVPTPITPAGEAVRYRVTLEPTYRNWVFALDTVDASPRHNIFIQHDRVLWRSEPVDSVLTYDASSHLRTVSRGPLSIAGRRYETGLPADRNPRALALARELRAQSRDDVDYSRRVLDWFRDSGLEYTLEPGQGALDSVDHVLFDSRRGFCGHFASAYATLMRAAGIPARVVTGYLGGEWNPAGRYLIVRQSDAHAWTEIWLDGQGWTRIDPTAVVAPERLSRGVYDVLSDDASLGISLRRAPWMVRMGQLWDGMNTWWRDQVLGFDIRSQLSFLRSLGIDSPDWRHLGWGFAGALVLWLAWVTSTLRRSVARVKPDRVARAWLKATRKLEKVAAPRAPGEGAMNYAARIATQHPHLAASVTAVAERYTRLRFGREAANEDIAELEREVSRLAV